MQRKRQSLGGAGIIITPYLAHPRAPHVSDPGRRGVLSVQRWKAWSQLAHTARVSGGALYPVIRYGAPL